MRTRAPRLAIDGVLLLDKPLGLSSQAAVTRVKAVFDAAKAGHTGTLDPAATGLLPVVLGEATKFSSALLDAGKSYLATLRLGQTTTTGDLEGQVTSTCDIGVSLADIERALAPLRGEISQVPPMFSALKHAGKPLYKYAREGAEVERTARTVTISALELLDFDGRDLKIAVSCSKGTYIRVLAEDIGAALGCGACLAALRRTRVGRLDVSDALTLDALARLADADRLGSLLPVDALLAELPAVDLDSEQASRICTGAAVSWQRQREQCPEEGLVRLYDPARRFLGVAVATPDGSLRPQRLVASTRRNLEKAGH